MAASSLQTSLNWLNIYAELLGVQSYSLWRVRAILTAQTTSPDECEADVHLLIDEVQRVRDRFRYWEEVVEAYNA